MDDGTAAADQLLVEQREHTLTDYWAGDEPFGLKGIGREIGEIPVAGSNDTALAILDNEFDFGEYPPPLGWSEDAILDATALLEGEFNLLVPHAGTGYSDEQIARALMQIFEAWSEPEAYVGSPDYLPQTLQGFVPLVKWLKDLGIITSNVSVPYRDGGAFNLTSLEASLTDIEAMGSVSTDDDLDEGVKQTFNYPPRSIKRDPDLEDDRVEEISPTDMAYGQIGFVTPDGRVFRAAGGTMEHRDVLDILRHNPSLKKEAGTEYKWYTNEWVGKTWMYWHGEKYNKGQLNVRVPLKGLTPKQRLAIKHAGAFTHLLADTIPSETDEVAYEYRRGTIPTFLKHGLLGLKAVESSSIVSTLLEQDEDERPARPTGRSQTAWNRLDADTQDMMVFIAKAAKARQLVRIRYTPKVTTGTTVNRTVRPYSLRIRNIHVNGYDQPAVPTVVFFGYDAFARTIKMFVADRVGTVERTGREYDPQWAVEFESKLTEAESRTGRCYELAGRWQLQHDDDEALLVHGHISNRHSEVNYPELNHAWITKGDQVWEPTTDKWIDKGAFYALYHAQEYAVYTHEELLLKLARTQNWGPWDTESLGESLTEEESSGVPEAKSFYIQQGFRSGTADLSVFLAAPTGPGSPVQKGEVWYYFNRLFVPQQLRRQGIATKLMTQVVEWADTNNYNIWNDINPYGEMDLDQLIKFYKKFGFEEIAGAAPYSGKGSLIRLARSHSRESLMLHLGEAQFDQDAEAERMLQRYESEPVSLWMYSDLSIEDRMAWAYLGADEMMGAPYQGDQVRQFVAALKMVVAKPADFWQQIAAKDPLRAKRLQSLEWTLEKVPLEDVGVWVRFGGFPDEWTKGNVIETAAFVSAGAEKPQHKQEILEIAAQWATVLKFLPPVLVPGEMLRDVPGYKPTTWAIDDGNHRIVAAAIGGAKSIIAFVGREPGGQVEPAEQENEALNEQRGPAYYSKFVHAVFADISQDWVPSMMKHKGDPLNLEGASAPLRVVGQLLGIDAEQSEEFSRQMAEEYSVEFNVEDDRIYMAWEQLPPRYQQQAREYAGFFRGGVVGTPVETTTSGGAGAFEVPLGKVIRPTKFGRRKQKKRKKRKPSTETLVQGLLEQDDLPHPDQGDWGTPAKLGLEFNAINRIAGLLDDADIEFIELYKAVLANGGAFGRVGTTVPFARLIVPTDFDMDRVEAALGDEFIVRIITFGGGAPAEFWITQTLEDTV